MLKSKREIQLRKTVDVPLQNAIAFLQDEECMVQPGEFVYHRAPDPKDPTKLVVKEHLPILGPIKGSTTFTAKLIPMDDGCQIDVEAGMGTKVSNRYYAKEVDSEDGSGRKVTEISEVSTVETFFAMMPYVYKTMYKAHEYFYTEAEARIRKQKP